jgi:pimeloyl-ACP methyl ester carboxylesterase
MAVLHQVPGGLFATRFGDPPFEVLALPGWMRTVSDFDQVLEGMSALAVDLPGFGGAQPPPQTPWSTREYAEALLPLLVSFPTPPLVCGHSFGGRVALQLASTRSDLIQSLVLTGVPQLIAHPKQPPSMKHRLLRVSRKVGLVSDRRMEAWRRNHGSSDYRNAVGVMRDVLVKAVNENYEEQLCSLRVPTTFVWGELDTAAPLADARRALEMTPIGVGSLQVLEGVGHLTPTEAPHSIASAIRSRITG